MGRVEENDMFDLFVKARYTNDGMCIEEGHYGNIVKAADLRCKFCGKKPVKYYYKYSLDCVFACEAHKGRLRDEEKERWDAYGKYLHDTRSSDCLYHPKFI